MAAALFLGQHVHLADEVGVRMNRAGLGQHLAALDLVALHAAKQQADVVARFRQIQQLAEHLNARHNHLTRLVHQTHDLHRVAQLHHAALHTARRNRAAAGDGEHVLNRHQERLVRRTLRSRNVVVHRVHQLEDALRLLGVANVGAAVLHVLQSLQRAALDDRNLVAREVILAQQLADLHLHQLQQLRIVHHVRLVQEHHDVGHAYLTGQQNVLTGLRHRAVGSGYH